MKKNKSLIEILKENKIVWSRTPDKDFELEKISLLREDIVGLKILAEKLTKEVDNQAKECGFNTADEMLDFYKKKDKDEFNRF